MLFWKFNRKLFSTSTQDTFASNPQYFLSFEASDVDGDADKCTVVVSLIQKSSMNRTFSRRAGVESQCIGFRIFQVTYICANIPKILILSLPMLFCVMFCP